MKHLIVWPMTMAVLVIIACAHPNRETVTPIHQTQAITGAAEILQFWHGDYPVDGLEMLPEEASQPGTGYIADPKVFEMVWTAFKPDEPVPVIDFESNLVIFVRNIQYFNRISIGKIKLKEGVAEVLAMETRSAMPIEDRVAISMVEVSRHGIIGIQARGGVIWVRD